MGLMLTNKNKEVYIGYMGFYFIRQEVANSINEEVGNLYKKLNYDYKYTKEDNDYLDENLNKYLNEFLYHSDCDGYFENESVKGIYEELKKLKPSFENERLQEKYIEILEIFKDGKRIDLF